MKKFLSSNYFIFLSLFLMLMFNYMAMKITNLIHLWILLEINFLIFIFLLIQTNNHNKSDSITPIFFIIQSVSSLILIFIFNMKKLNLLENNYMMIWYAFSIIIKLGLFPFTWLPPIFLSNVNWMTIFAYATLQKFIPFMIVKNFNDPDCDSFFLMICLLSIFSSTVKALFYKDFKSVMALSSINNTSWMMSISVIDFYSFFALFVVYTIISFLLFFLLFKWNINKISDLLNICILNNKLISFFYLIILLFLMSMLPPIISFNIKMNIIASMVTGMNIYILALMICSSLAIFIYLSIFIKAFYFINMKYKLLYETSKFKFMYSTILLSSIILTLSIGIYIILLE